MPVTEQAGETTDGTRENSSGDIAPTVHTRTPSPNKKFSGSKTEQALTNELNLDKITPELAAKIVKHFILPMFENAPSAKHGRRLGHN